MHETTTQCKGDHSNRLHCPVHGYDRSVPPPKGFKWHTAVAADGSKYTAMYRSESVQG